MSADHEGLSNGDRLTMDMMDTRLFVPSMDSPRYSLSDAYCQHCSCVATTSAPESASQTVYGIDYLRYWDCWYTIILLIVLTVCLHAIIVFDILKGVRARVCLWN